MAEVRPTGDSPSSTGSGDRLTPARVPRLGGRTPILVEHTAEALAAVCDALHDVPFSREAVRAEVVRYGAVARDAGSNVGELREALDATLSRALAGFPGPLAAELRVHAGWWAAHGYHRAD